MQYRIFMKGKDHSSPFIGLRYTAEERAFLTSHGRNPKPNFALELADGMFTFRSVSSGGNASWQAGEAWSFEAKYQVDKLGPLPAGALGSDHIEVSTSESLTIEGVPVIRFPVPPFKPRTTPIRAAKKTRAEKKQANGKLVPAVVKHRDLTVTQQTRELRKAMLDLNSQLAPLVETGRAVAYLKDDHSVGIKLVTYTEL